MIQLKIRADLARLAASCMATNDIRYYLNGLKVEPRAEGGVFIIGCDGHRLCAVIDDTGSCSQEVVLCVDKAMRSRLPRPALSAKDKSLQRLELHEFMGKPALMLTSKETLGYLPEYVVPNAVIEGKFPDWRRVVPKFDELTKGLRDAINPQYVQDVLDAFDHGVRHRLTYTPYQTKDSASIWQISGHEHVLLIVMPRNGDRGNSLEALTKNWTGDAIKIKATEPEAAPAQEPVAVQMDVPGKRNRVRKPAAAGAQAEAAAQSSEG